MAVDASQTELHMNIVRELNWLRGNGDACAEYDQQTVTNARPDTLQLCGQPFNNDLPFSLWLACRPDSGAMRTKMFEVNSKG